MRCCVWGWWFKLVSVAMMVMAVMRQWWRPQGRQQWRWPWWFLTWSISCLSCNSWCATGGIWEHHHCQAFYVENVETCWDMLRYVEICWDMLRFDMIWRNLMKSQHLCSSVSGALCKIWAAQVGEVRRPPNVRYEDAGHTDCLVLQSYAVQICGWPWLAMAI
jgi:hypothetical protein